jgi:MSHA type pilus biogenesis protein MshL
MHNFLSKHIGPACRFAALLIMASGAGLMASAQTQPPEAPASPEPEEVLLKTIPFFSQDEQPIGKVFQSLGRSYGISIICDKDVTGDIFVEFHNITLRGILDALCASEGYFWQLEEAGYITVRRFKTIIYYIEYPQLERKGTSKATINLGQTNYNASQSGGGSGGTSGGGSGGSTAKEDEASVTIEQSNDNQFWKTIENEIKELKQKDERIIFDRFSGTIVATASRHTHDYLQGFLNTINSRIGQQVEIIGKLVEVQLSDANKLGIDWSLVGAKIGKFNLSLGSATNFKKDKLGGTEYGSTIAGTISGGKIASVFDALAEQGTLNTVTAPRLVTLNNQTAYIKDTEDRPYFQLRQASSNTSASSGGMTTYQSEQYDIQTISIGTLVAITPHIADNGDITLDVTPALTRLKENIRSKDEKIEAPALYVKTTSTIVRLRSGETAIIGGIVSDSITNTTRSVPGLGKIPLVGALFRSEGKAKEKTELVIMLTPRILVPGSSLSAEGRAEAERDSRAVRSAINFNSSASAGPMVRTNSHSNRPVEAISLID